MSENDTAEQQEFDRDFNAWLLELEGEIQLTQDSERLTAAELSTIVNWTHVID